MRWPRLQIVHRWPDHNLPVKLAGKTSEIARRTSCMYVEQLYPRRRAFGRAASRELANSKDISDSHEAIKVALLGEVVEEDLLIFVLCCCGLPT